jgi:hypothetical protein
MMCVALLRGWVAHALFVIGQRERQLRRGAFPLLFEHLHEIVVAPGLVREAQQLVWISMREL